MKSLSIPMSSVSIKTLSIFLMICLIQSATGWGQDANSKPTADESPLVNLSVVTIDVVDALKARIDTAAELPAEQKTAALDWITKAMTSLTLAADFTARELAANESLKKVDETRLKLQKELETLQEQARSRERDDEVRMRLDRMVAAIENQSIVRSKSDADYLTLEQDLALKKSSLSQAQAELEAIDSRINERAESQRSRKDRITAVPIEKEALSKQISDLPATIENDLLTEAKRISFIAERQRLDVEVPALQMELALMNAEEAATLSLLRRQLKSIEVERLKQETQYYTEAVNRIRKADAHNRRADALAQATKAFDSNKKWQHALGLVFEDNVALIDDELGVQTKLQNLQRSLSETEKSKASFSEEFEQIKSRADRTGASRSFGIRLRQQRKLLPDTVTLRRQVRERMQDYEDAQLHYFDLREKRKKLDDIEDEVDALYGQNVSAPLTHGQRDRELSDQDVQEINQKQNEIKQKIRTAYGQQRDDLGLVIAAYDKYIEELEDYESSQIQLADLSDQIAAYVDERVLWIRSHESFTFASLTSDYKSLFVFIDRAKWNRIGAAYWFDLGAHLFVYSLFVVIWIFLLATQSRQTIRIKQTSKKAASRLNTSMKPTIQALLMTISKASILPLPLFFLGWRLSAGAYRDGIDAEKIAPLLHLADNLRYVGFGLLTLELIRNVHRPQGLAQSHFSWSESGSRIVSQQIQSFIWLVTPLVIAIAVLDAWTVEGDTEALSRLLSIGVYLLLALTMHRLADPEEGTISSWVQQNKNGWIDRFAFLFHFLSVLLPVVMAVLTGVGFTYATNRLAVKFGQTIIFLYGLLFIRAFLIRWLGMRHRRMAIEQARQARQALQHDEKHKDIASVLAVPDTTDGKSTLAEVSAQTRRLMSTTIVIVAIVGVWLIWTDVLPALHYFDNLMLPGTQLRIPSLIAAMMIAILTATAARNIPGLLQITLLEWLPIEKSSRYAIAAVTQYCIAIVGLLAISGQLRIGWDQVQFLAAALTFGLGFGLQEIFANFVSGLIILFEQPVRVGDVVTIDGVSGVVNRIRIRSTTITDWDRKEYIVPNREFITGKLLNWTLTDTTNRITFEVGISYSSDPVQAHALIIQCIQEHPFVLPEPVPLVTFEAFGDSSLNFKIRAYLPSLDQRLQTVHDLHVSINKAFRQAGIEIPFPQRDLHLRSAIPLPINTNPAVPAIRTQAPPEAKDVRKAE